MNIDVDVIDSALVIFANFKMDVTGVDPIQTLSDVSSAIGQSLSGSSARFNEVASTFGTAFSSASDFLARIAASDQIQLSLDANIDVDVQLDLSWPARSVKLTTSVNDLRASISALISDELSISVAGLNVDVHPHIELNLFVENTATPFIITNGTSALSNFSFGGDFNGYVVVGLEGFPAELSLRAKSEDITNASSTAFEVQLEINLLLVKARKCQTTATPLKLQVLNTFYFVEPCRNRGCPEQGCSTVIPFMADAKCPLFAKYQLGLH